MGLFRKLVLVFTLVPLVEFFIFYQLASVVSLPMTVGIIIVTGFLGAWLSKSQGFKAFNNYQKAMSEGRMPHQEAIDGLLILIAGAVLLTPGFLTDIVGFALLIAPIREQIKVIVGNKLKDKIQVVGQEVKDPISGKSSQTSSGDVITIEAEVVDEKVDR